MIPHQQDHNSHQPTPAQLFYYTYACEETSPVHYHPRGGVVASATRGSPPAEFRHHRGGEAKHFKLDFIRQTRARASSLRMKRKQPCRERERRSNIKSRGYASAPPGAFGGLPFSFSLVLRLFQRGDEKEGLDDVVAEKPAVRRIKGQKMMRGEKERRQRADIRIVSGHLAESADLHFAFAAPRDASERIYRSHLSIFISLSLSAGLYPRDALAHLYLSLSPSSVSLDLSFSSLPLPYMPPIVSCVARARQFFFRLSFSQAQAPSSSSSSPPSSLYTIYPPRSGAHSYIYTRAYLFCYFLFSIINSSLIFLLRAFLLLSSSPISSFLHAVSARFVFSIFPRHRTREGLGIRYV